MVLTTESVNKYEEEGFLLLTDVFSAGEIKALVEELPSLFGWESAERVLEADSETVRSVHAPHQRSHAFALLASDARLVEPARQLLASDVYIHQYKVNAKAAFQGDVWEWHQDYIYWLREDGLPTPRATNVVVFLDDVTEFNGPLILIPRSQHEGIIDVPLGDRADRSAAYRDSPVWIVNVTANAKYSLDQTTLSDLAMRHGMVAPKGRAGSVLIFHPNLVHGSAMNMSPFRRAAAIVTYNSVANIPKARHTPRPEFLASRDYSPVAPALHRLDAPH